MAKKTKMDLPKWKQKTGYNYSGMVDKDEDMRLEKFINFLYVDRRSDSLGKLMIEAGYSPVYATNPNQLKATKRYQEKVKPYLAKIRKLKELAMQSVLY